MERRKRHSIFDLIERYMELIAEEMSGLPFDDDSPGIRKRQEQHDAEEWLRAPFEDMIKGLEEELPGEYKEFITRGEVPEGKVKRYGPFIYGFSYTKEPGKEPEIKEFGNIRPSYNRMEPVPGGDREPLIDVIEQKDCYEVVAELPGVEKKDVKLHATENSLEIKTENEIRFYKEILFDTPVQPKTAKATYKNGVLSVKLKKKEVDTEKTSIALD